MTSTLGGGADHLRFQNVLRKCEVKENLFGVGFATD